MNERDIFLAAIEITDPARLAAYLDQACADDAELRAQVEELLKTHNETSQFLETPAVATDSAVDQTILTDASDTDDDPVTGRTSGEAEFRKYLEPATRPDWLGRLAHYEIEEILGRGAFGIVAKAFDEKLHRVVAVKLMNPELAATSPPRKRFLREARTAAAVSHENIVAIHAVEEEPIPYLVMEYISGQTLQQRMDAKGPLNAQEVLRIGQHVAAGLAAAHAANLIHRDIKPSNILLTGGPAERAKISDFGLARAVDDATMTSSGLIAGTPMYMAPEQARGETLDHRADLFSLGSVLYQMAGGRPPFRAANTVAVLKRVCEDTPRPLADVLPGTPDWLETIIFKLLEKEREDRYQTAQEVADLLARCQRELEDNGKVTCVEGRADLAETQVLRPRKTTDTGSRKKPLGWLVGGVIALLIAVAVYMNLSGPKAWPRGAWDAADHDRDGVLTRQEMELFATQQPHRNGPRLLWHFDSADTNHDGIVDDAEFEAYGYAVGSKDPDDHLPPPTSTTDSPVGLPSPLETDGWHGWPTDAPPPAIAPFNAQQARKHQEEWAKYLGVPVEYENSIGMKFRLIPPGEFLMGKTPSEVDAGVRSAGDDLSWRERAQAEGPQHKVILTQPIYVSTTEVTQSQYEQVMELNPAYFSAGQEGGDLVADLDCGKLPVEMVSWYDAGKFCDRLSLRNQLTPFYTQPDNGSASIHGSGYRLPTEAEWEWACRAGTTTRFWPGNSAEELSATAWFNSNSDAHPHCVGELRPNPFGLADMHGNVWEWVQDSWDPTFYASFSGSSAIDPIHSPEAGLPQVIRGGNWNNNYDSCHVAHRTFHQPTDRHGNIGFRVVLPVDAVRRRITQEPETGSWHGWPADAPAPAIAPFDAAQAKAHQEAWAKYLDIPVEYENSIGMKFRLIPPGEFLMGSTPAEIEAALKVAVEDTAWKERINSEAPQHRVILTEPVYVGVIEVTQSQYEQVMGANPSHFSATGKGKEAVANLETGNHPVETVSWNDAAEFCAKLSQQEQLKPYYFRSDETITPLGGTGYRLPTEAEWESACRAGTTTRFWNGDEDNDLVSAGWFGRNSGGRTHAAGELKANPFGLFDIHGNVSEWVQDSWDPAFYGKLEENATVSPSTPFSSGSQRVFRGGHWFSDPSYSRSSYRSAYPPTTRAAHLGFRVVLVAESVRVSRP